MTEDHVDLMIRHAIGGDGEAIAWVVTQAATSDDAVVIAMAAVLRDRPAWLDRARATAATSRDRQVVEIARSHLEGRDELVDALARDHLVDHPDSLIVSWIASGAVGRRRDSGEA